MHILVDAKERGGLDTNISKYRRPHPLLQSSVENLLLTVREILILSLAGVCGPSSDNFGSFHFHGNELPGHTLIRLGHPICVPPPLNAFQHAQLAPSPN